MCLGKEARKKREIKKKKEMERRRRERQKVEKTTLILSELKRGDDAFKTSHHKEAFYNFMRARNIAGDFIPHYLSTCEEKIKDVREEVENLIRFELEKSMQSIETILLDNNFQDIEDIEKQFFDHLKSYDWLNVSKFFHDFQKLMISYWDALFPKLVTQADSFYDEGQFTLAKELFVTCKNLIKKFGFGNARSNLIMAFKHYEMICDVQLIMGKMHQEITLAVGLINKNKVQEAISCLSEINNLEEKIPIKYRDKRQLQSLHSRITQLRREVYNNSKT